MRVFQCPSGHDSRLVYLRLELGSDWFVIQDCYMPQSEVRLGSSGWGVASQVGPGLHLGPTWGMEGCSRGTLFVWGSVRGEDHKRLTIRDWVAWSDLLSALSSSRKVVLNVGGGSVLTRGKTLEQEFFERFAVENPK